MSFFEICPSVVPAKYFLLVYFKFDVVVIPLLTTEINFTFTHLKIYVEMHVLDNV